MMIRKKISLLDLELTKYRQHQNQITKKSNLKNSKILNKIKIDIRSFINMRYCLALKYKKKGYEIDSEFLSLLRNKIRHVLKRKILKNHGLSLKNILVIISEYQCYKLFSNGLKSQLKDIYLLIKDYLKF